MDLDDSLDSLKGIGEKTKQTFQKAGIENLRDLITHYPRNYESYDAPKQINSLQEGEVAAVAAQLTAPLATRYIRGLSISTALCSDGSDVMAVTWFNMPFLKNQIRSGVTYVFRGRIKAKGQRLLMEQPAVFQTEQYEGLAGVLRPVYSLVKGLTGQMIQKAVRQVLAQKSLLQDYLPEEFRTKYQLAEYNYAIEQIHFPKDYHAMLLARKRLVFDEFFFFILQLRSLKSVREKSENHFRILPGIRTVQLLEHLPYTLTSAQMRVWKTIEKELQGESVMARLIQGDVGSGKTIVSILALIMVADSGYQGALMVPTEVLARQHYQSVCELIEQNAFPFSTVLLTGSMTAKQKREAYEKISGGEASIIIGTHALIQEKVVYHSLALVITDEQHRFGVRQREMLSLKGQMPHTIVMSATPIPRTLAVILYGDLDISVINEMPSNRLPIKNCVVNTGYRKKAYEFIRRQVEEGHQAYVICPMVEESEAVEAENVVEYTEVLRGELPGDITVEYLHGKMKPSMKNEIMNRFLLNEIQVLVSTTVVEVGVNVPNATVMMIENAERFGLAQLHQLRGRVGRGSAQSYCIFMHAMDGKQIQERLDILCKSNDGFEIANKDMQLRGPGDLFGVRQSGMLDFTLADIYTDAEILQQANEAAGEILKKDPQLQLPEHQKLKAHFELLIRHQTDHLNL
ncbi:MAG: ATP-dependent DNA helicase RecG [Lachnospiraceae bacterium]|nr:ATP-dependent DNA helicase RecG [Lachnospiraceae bacterium]